MRCLISRQHLFLVYFFSICWEIYYLIICSFLSVKEKYTGYLLGCIISYGRLLLLYFLRIWIIMSFVFFGLCFLSLYTLYTAFVLFNIFIGFSIIVYSPLLLLYYSQNWLLWEHRFCCLNRSSFLEWLCSRCVVLDYCGSNFAWGIFHFSVLKLSQLFYTYKCVHKFLLIMVFFPSTLVVLELLFFYLVLDYWSLIILRNCASSQVFLKLFSHFSFPLWIQYCFLFEMVLCFLSLFFLFGIGIICSFLCFCSLLTGSK